MGVGFNKPKVTIDLEEYNYLLDKIKYSEKEENLNYDEAYSELFYFFSKGNTLDWINKYSNKYEYLKIANPMSERGFNFIVKLKKNNNG